MEHVSFSRTPEASSNVGTARPSRAEWRFPIQSVAKVVKLSAKEATTEPSNEPARELGKGPVDRHLYDKPASSREPASQPTASRSTSFR